MMQLSAREKTSLAGMVFFIGNKLTKSYDSQIKMFGVKRWFLLLSFAALTLGQKAEKALKPSERLSKQFSLFSVVTFPNEYN